MKNKSIKNTKKLIRTIRERFNLAVISLSLAAMTSPVTAFATSVSLAENDALGIKAKMQSLAGVLLAAGAAGGIVLLVYGGIKFAFAYQKQDQNGESEALKTIITAIMLGGLSTIVNLII